MAIVKKQSLKEMNPEAMQQKLSEIEMELRREKGMIKGTGKPNNPGKYREMRRLRARIKTLLGKQGIKV